MPFVAAPPRGLFRPGPRGEGRGTERKGHADEEDADNEPTFLSVTTTGRGEFPAAASADRATASRYDSLSSSSRRPRDRKSPPLPRVDGLSFGVEYRPRRFLAFPSHLFPPADQSLFFYLSIYLYVSPRRSVYGAVGRSKDDSRRKLSRIRLREGYVTARCFVPPN